MRGENIGKGMSIIRLLQTKKFAKWYNEGTFAEWIQEDHSEEKAKKVIEELIKMLGR